MQLNLRTDQQFLDELDALVHSEGLGTRTAAIKYAVHTVLEQHRRSTPAFDFHSLIGIAGSLSPNDRFATDKELFQDMP